MSYLQRAFEVERDAGITADATLWAGNLAQAHIESRHWDEAERYNEDAKRSARRRERQSAPTVQQRSRSIGRAYFDVASRLGPAGAR